MQDFKRMERLNNDDWCYIGIIAEATIKTDEGNFRLDNLSSFGLWGVESDSGDDYIKEVEAEQLQDLKKHLQAFNVNVRNFNKIRIEYKDC
jgi:hypothetical protein